MKNTKLSRGGSSTIVAGLELESRIAASQAEHLKLMLQGSKQVRVSKKLMGTVESLESKVKALSMKIYLISLNEDD